MSDNIDCAEEMLALCSDKDREKLEKIIEEVDVTEMTDEINSRRAAETKKKAKRFGFKMVGRQ